MRRRRDPSAPTSPPRDDTPSGSGLRAARNHLPRRGRQGRRPKVASTRRTARGGPHPPRRAAEQCSALRVPSPEWGLWQRLETSSGASRHLPRARGRLWVRRPEVATTRRMGERRTCSATLTGGPSPSLRDTSPRRGERQAAGDRKGRPYGGNGGHHPAQEIPLCHGFASEKDPDGAELDGLQHPEKQTLCRGRDPSTPVSHPLRMTRREAERSGDRSLLLAEIMSLL